jgi:hypothetical protein
VSRYYNEDCDWDPGRQALWDNAVNRATYSKRGQAALKELEQALLALPEKKLIDGLLCDGVGVCAVGALAAYREVKGGKTWDQAFAILDESGHYDIEDGEEASLDETAYFARDKLKMALSLAWEVAFNNDHGYGSMAKTDEERYERMLTWVRARIKQEATA